MFGINFNGKHSYNNFGITLAPGKTIGIPSKNKIFVTVPFSNQKYDFSELYGDQTYTERTLTYSFNIKDQSKKHMTTKKTEIINWLMNSNGKQKLYDDTIPGYYFLAEVEDESAFNENWEDGILTVNFEAYPFMIAEYPEGHDIWNEINFDLDAFQPVEFEVNGPTDVTLLNVGTPDITPIITASDDMVVEMNGVIFNVPTGESKSKDFVLKSGENSLHIDGNGSISFLFYKELI
ncbi:phage tail protein [Anaerobacillus alkalilacustris]|uniref:Phage tail protein n=1 Tax=Anaerobacillus alkalilacustris TaxID=393763 RepID=A0A1S2LK78_9BACI|nr:phage tail protein [Anaerobacillus alkalilacustris]